MKTTPLTERCLAAIEKRSHACFGISPFNSYFSEERIRELAAWGKNEFGSIHFFVPDVPSAYTLEALGYDSEKAAWKARRQSQCLMNKIQRSLRSVGYTEFEAWEKILNWEKLAANDRYVDTHEDVMRQFESYPSFRRACFSASHWVLEKRVQDASALSPEALGLAVKYLLAEIPLFIDTPNILGKEASVFCYHQRVDFIEGLFKGRYPVQASSMQGFLVINPDQATKEVSVQTLPHPELA